MIRCKRKSFLAPVGEEKDVDRLCLGEEILQRSAGWHYYEARPSQNLFGLWVTTLRWHYMEQSPEDSCTSFSFFWYPDNPSSSFNIEGSPVILVDSRNHYNILPENMTRPILTSRSHNHGHHIQFDMDDLRSWILLQTTVAARHLLKETWAHSTFSGFRRPCKNLYPLVQSAEEAEASPAPSRGSGRQQNFGPVGRGPNPTRRSISVVVREEAGASTTRKRFSAQLKKVARRRGSCIS